MKADGWWSGLRTRLTIRLCYLLLSRLSDCLSAVIAIGIGRADDATGVHVLRARLWLGVGQPLARRVQPRIRRGALAMERAGRTDQAHRPRHQYRLSCL